MEKTLTEKLWNYIIDNNPELMFNLQESYSVSQYLKDKVAAVSGLIKELKHANHPEPIIQEICMEELTRELKPSRYNYVKAVLEEEFTEKAMALRESGSLTYEVINMMEACREVFDEMGFSLQNEEDRMLHYAVTGEIAEYLQAAREEV